MTNINKNIVRAAVLQELAQPFTLIYVDIANRNLYFAVRTSSRKEKINPTYSAVETSRKEIEDYMQEKKSLDDIFNNRKTLEFKIVDDDVVVSDEYNFVQDQNFNAMKWFDPEFCEEEGWIELFLNRHEAGDVFDII